MSSTKRYRRLELGSYVIPEDALWLAEDIATLEIMASLLDRLKPTSFIPYSDANYADRKNEAYKTIRRLAFIIQYMKRTAEEILVREYLAGCKIKRPYRQSIAEVYQLLMEGFNSK